NDEGSGISRRDETIGARSAARQRDRGRDADQGSLCFAARGGETGAGNRTLGALSFCGRQTLESFGRLKIGLPQGEQFPPNQFVLGKIGQPDALLSSILIACRAISHFFVHSYHPSGSHLSGSQKPLGLNTYCDAVGVLRHTYFPLVARLPCSNFGVAPDMGVLRSRGHA